MLPSLVRSEYTVHHHSSNFGPRWLAISIRSVSFFVIIDTHCHYYPMFVIIIIIHHNFHFSGISANENWGFTEKFMILQPSYVCQWEELYRRKWERNGVASDREQGFDGKTGNIKVWFTKISRDFRVKLLMFLPGVSAYDFGSPKFP